MHPETTTDEWLIDGSCTSPGGYRASGVHCGLKPEQPDLALVVSDAPAVAAATMTTNKVKAAPLLVTRENLRHPTCRGIVINSGNANACTGEEGMTDARRMTALAATAVGCLPEEILVASTGVIGVYLDMEKVESGIAAAAGRLRADGGTEAVRAIMTTDTRPKHCALRIDLDGVAVTLGGMVKGAGMIAPNMATMIAVITTDAAVDREALKRAVRYSVARTFNSITVDGDTSTNDLVAVLANGAATNPQITVGTPAFDHFQTALEQVLQRLAVALVRDGEGASKLIEVAVTGALSEEDAHRMALTIANSPLVKTAVFGNDPNWGRVAMAAGKSSAALDPSRLAIHFGEVEVMRDGTATRAPAEALAAVMQCPDVRISVDAGVGAAAWTVWTCDLTYEYVRINAEYTT